MTYRCELKQLHKRRHGHSVDGNRHHNNEDGQYEHHIRLVAAVERRGEHHVTPHVSLALAPHVLIAERVVDGEAESEADGAAQPAPPHDHRLLPRAPRAEPAEQREMEEDRSAAREEDDGVDAGDHHQGARADRVEVLH